MGSSDLGGFTLRYFQQLAIYSNGIWKETKTEKNGENYKRKLIS